MGAYKPKIKHILLLMYVLMPRIWSYRDFICRNIYNYQDIITQRLSMVPHQVFTENRENKDNKGKWGRLCMMVHLVFTENRENMENRDNKG